MGEKLSLKVAKRSVFGKKVAKLRKEGHIPGVVYGAGMEPNPVQAEESELVKVLRAAGKHTPVMLTLDGKKHIAMVKDVETESVRTKVTHVSFHAVKQDQPVVAEVPIRLDGEGESPAERAGLIVLQNLEVVEVKALPLDLPSELLADIRELKEPGDRITLGDVKLPENVELVERTTGREEELDEGEEQPTITDLVIATVYEPSALQAANEAAAGDAADESEVVAESGAEAAPAEAAEASKAE